MLTDLEDIKAWAEERNGVPVTVQGTGKRGEPGVLRIDFPGYSGEGTLKKISWEDWYQKFQESNLAFLCQDRTKTGKMSRFFKLVCREEKKPARRSRAVSRRG
jgi:hypothetical protein